MNGRVRLCMFHPNDRPMERGWVGRIDGDRVVHLAAQTLQHFFTGGASSREHAAYALDEVTLVTPVLHPPSVRVFASATDFAFANPAAVVGPRVEVARPAPILEARARVAAVVGASGTIGGYTACIQWRAPSLPSAKADDFGIAIGPVVVAGLDPDGLSASLRRGSTEVGGVASGFDWEDARRLAERGTQLRAGDLLLGPPVAVLEGVTDGVVELELRPVGTLVSPLAV